MSLQVVEEYADEKGLRRIKQLKQNLLETSLTYIRNGKEGTQQDRIRKVSDLAGIPRVLLESALK